MYLFFSTIQQQFNVISGTLFYDCILSLCRDEVGVFYSPQPKPTVWFGIWASAEIVYIFFTFFLLLFFSYFTCLSSEMFFIQLNATALLSLITPWQFFQTMLFHLPALCPFGMFSITKVTRVSDKRFVKFLVGPVSWGCKIQWRHQCIGIRLLYSHIQQHNTYTYRSGNIVNNNDELQWTSEHTSL